MRHGGEVGVVGLAVDGRPQRHGERRRRPAEGVLREQVSQPDQAARLVGHLDAQGRAAGDAVDAHRLGLERQRQVVLQVDDLADLDPRRRLELVDGDHRAGGDALDRALDPELGAAAAHQLAETHQLVLLDLGLGGLDVQQVERRQLLAARLDPRKRDPALRPGFDRLLGPRRDLGQRRGRRLGRGRRALDTAHREMPPPRLLGDAQGKVDLRGHGRRRRLLGAPRLGGALQVLGHHPAPRPLLEPALAAPRQHQPEALEERGQPPAPARQQLTERRLDDQARTDHDGAEQHEERAGETHRPRQVVGQERPQPATRRHLPAAPRHRAQGHLEEPRQRQEKHRAADAAPEDPVADAAPEVAEGGDEEERGDQQRGDPENAEGDGRQLGAHRPDPVAHRGRPGRLVKETRVARMVADQGRRQEEPNDQEDGAEQLRALLRRQAAVGHGDPGGGVRLAQSANLLNTHEL